MSRADAWIMDPFGAQLGRWGGPPSGGVAPQWYDPIVAVLTDGGATGYLWVKDLGITTAVGQPVSDWEDVTGAVAWSQPGASSLRPILQASGLVYDGIDDRLNAAGFDSALAGSTWTMAVGMVAQVSGSTVYWAITDNTTTNLYNPVTSTQRLSVIATTADNLFLSTTPAPPQSVWYTRNGTSYTRRLGATEASATSALSPAGLSVLTLGARRSPSAGVFLNGTIAWVAVTTRALNTTERANINSILAAQGYPT